QVGNVQAPPSSPQASTLVDVTVPSSAASVLSLSSSNSISVPYVASDNPGGSGVAEIDLYVQGPTDSTYSKVASDTSGSGSGSFPYTASEGDGTYGFYTLATDKAGNVQAAPATAQSSTLLDTTAPTAKASAPASAGQG